MVTVSAKQAEGLHGQLRAWAYNALDCTGTLEVFETIHSLLNERTARTYAFERACQSPAFAMMRRGVAINEVKRSSNTTNLKRELKRMEKAVDKIPKIREIWDGHILETGECSRNSGKRHRWPRGVPDRERKCTLCNADRVKRSPFNPASSHQCKRLFYTLFGIPEQRNKAGNISTDGDVLLRIGKRWPAFAPITEAILETRGVKKQIGFLNAQLTNDGRFPSSFNVGTAWTGRWSSSKNPFGLGSNLQNISPKHRDMFIADAGYELCYADLSQAESKVVAYVANDLAYIEAHETGNVHVNAARIFWPGLDWNGDLAHDTKLAKNTPCPWKADQSYYDQSKRNQHGLNYGLSPHGLAMQAQMPLAEAQRATEVYYENFPFIRAYHKDIAAKIQEVQPLINPLGRECKLFGRPWDGHTIKQGYAFIPQSTVADIINIAIYRLWKAHDPELIQILGQIHDAVLCQYAKASRAAAHTAILEALTVPVKIGERTMIIGVDLEYGSNWGKKSESNPNGIGA